MYLTSSKKTQNLSTYQEKDEVLDAISHWVVEGDHRMRVVVVDQQQPFEEEVDHEEDFDDVVAVGRCYDLVMNWRVHYCCDGCCYWMVNN